MADKRSRDPLLDAALDAADGHSNALEPALDDEARRVHGNLDKLAALRQVFAAHGEASEGGHPAAHWGHLRIEGLIGEGSFGRVYRAFDPVLQRDVALKLRRGHGDEAAGFIAEARRLARVRHPNVLAVHGADVHDGRVGLWTDLLDGDTLAETKPERGHGSRRAIAAIARQLASALQAIHAAGLVHGDVKAGNVMLSGAHVTLMDFGAAGDIGVRPRYGSPASMAPELKAGAAAGATGDIWSLGALLYQIATGRLPEAGKPTDLAAARRVLGRPLAGLLAQMLDPNPQRRLDAAGVGQRLQQIAELPRRRRRRLAVMLVVASLVAGLVASLLALQRVRRARERAVAVTQFLVDSVHRVQPESQNGPATLKTLFQTMARQVDPRLAGHPRSLAGMQVVIGQGLAEYGDPQAGLALVSQAVTWLDRHAPEALSDRASAHDILAMVHKDAHHLAVAGREARASIALYERMPRTRTRSLQLIHVHTLLGNVLYESGHWRQSADEHRRTLAERARLLGVESDALAVDYYNLGSVLYRLNRMDQACAAFAQAARRMSIKVGATPGVHLLFVRQSLARCAMERGDLAAARRQIAVIRAGYLRHYPADHFHVLNMDLMLAELEQRSGNARAALRAMRALPPKVFDNPDSRLHLVHVLIDNGRFAEARRTASPLLKRWTAATDPRAAYVPALLAWLDYRAGGDGDAVRQVVAQALARMQAAGYGSLREAQELKRWHAELTHVGQQAGSRSTSDGSGGPAHKGMNGGSNPLRNRRSVSKAPMSTPSISRGPPLASVAVRYQNGNDGAGSRPASTSGEARSSVKQFKHRNPPDWNVGTMLVVASSSTGVAPMRVNKLLCCSST